MTTTTRRFGTLASAALACAALATASPVAAAARAYPLPPGAPVSATFAAEVDGVAAPVEERDFVAQLQIALDGGPATHGQRLRSREDLLPYVEFGTGVDDRYRRAAARPARADRARTDIDSEPALPPGHVAPLAELEAHLLEHPDPREPHRSVQRLARPVRQRDAREGRVEAARARCAVAYA